MKDPRLSQAIASNNQSGPPESDPFAEYMWMEHGEEFNRQVVEELWEEDFIEYCFQEMLDEEEEAELFIPARDLSDAGGQRADRVTSILNPNAKEFTPGIQKHIM